MPAGMAVFRTLKYEKVFKRHSYNELNAYVSREYLFMNKSYISRSPSKIATSIRNIIIAAPANQINGFTRCLIQNETAHSTKNHIIIN